MEYEMKRLTDQQKVLVESNYKLVGWYMNKIPHNMAALHHDDLKQELSLGLIDAALTYNKERGGFATHAIWHFRSRLSVWRRKSVRHKRLRFSNNFDLTEGRKECEYELRIFRSLLERLPDEVKREIPRCERIFHGYETDAKEKYERQKAIRAIKDKLASLLMEEGI
jgi:RNA polymerase sigma factor (sigma-70 family)